MKDSLNDSPLVSVVVTGFNHEDFILETLRSVEAQTYPNIEIVVVDGGSTDRMGELAQKFLGQSRFPSIFYRQPDNVMQMKDRAKGLQLSRGELVSFLDSDDLLFPNKIEVQVRQLLDGACDAVYGNFVRLSEKLGRVPYRGAPFQAADAWDAELFIQRLVCHRGPMAQAGLFRRTLLEAAGGIDHGLQLNDWPFMIATARKASRIQVSADPVFYYRIHAGGHHTRNLMESLHWQLETARSFCSPRLLRKSKVRSYRVVANELLHQGQRRRAALWFFRGSLHGWQSQPLHFLASTLRHKQPDSVVAPEEIGA